MARNRLYDDDVLVIGLGRFGWRRRPRAAAARATGSSPSSATRSSPSPSPASSPGRPRRRRRRRTLDKIRPRPQLPARGRRHRLVRRGLGPRGRQPRRRRHPLDLGQGALPRARPHPRPHRRPPRHLPRGRLGPPGGAPRQRQDAGLHRVRRRLRHRQDGARRTRRSGFTLEQSQIRSKYGVTVVGVKAPGEDFTLCRARRPRSPRTHTLIVSGPTELVERLASRP